MRMTPLVVAVLSCTTPLCQRRRFEALKRQVRLPLHFYSHHPYQHHNTTPSLHPRTATDPLTTSTTLVDAPRQRWHLVWTPRAARVLGSLAPRRRDPPSIARAPVARLRPERTLAPLSQTRHRPRVQRAMRLLPIHRRTLAERLVPLRPLTTSHRQDRCSRPPSQTPGVGPLLSPVLVGAVPDASMGRSKKP